MRRVPPSPLPSPPAPGGERGPSPRAGSTSSAAVQLAWALDRAGAKVSVAALDPADRRRRAPFTCLACGEPLVPHLGKIRARHFAHRPGSSCPLTAPETALHVNAKERLLWLAAEAFAGRVRVTVLSRCPSCRRLAPRDLAALGDAAVGEGAVGPLRADVLVLARGRPALAVEVKVTHAVDAAKEAALAAAGVPAVEVDARAEWERAAPAGAVEIACARSLGFPACPACAATARADVDRVKGGEAAEIAELEAYRARGLIGVPPSPQPSPPAAGLGRGGGVRASSPPPAHGGSRAGAIRTSSPLPRVSGGEGQGEGVPGDRALSASERGALVSAFRCPDCGTTALQIGKRLARHPCAVHGMRPVAWRGYDGTLVELAWWRTDRRAGSG